MRPPMKPYRIKVVEPLAFTTGERRAALESAGWNLFNLRADQVTINLFTDSGTSAMSASQWTAMFDGDESYSGARSYYRFADVVKELTSYRHIFPVHQGRAAERIFFSALLHQGQISLSNTHFDTPRETSSSSVAERATCRVPRRPISPTTVLSRATSTLPH